MILDNIEYAYTGSRQKEGQQANGGQQNGSAGSYMGAPQGVPMQQPAQFIPQQPVQAPMGFTLPQQAQPVMQQVPQPSMGNPMALANFTGFEPFEGSSMFPT